tara:strand:+ start:282 stop:1763 length:1482 start_codon:yes stop_codon:yes gene_type:complete
MPQSYSTGAGGGQDRQAGGRGAGGGGQGNGGNNGIDAQQRAQMNAAAARAQSSLAVQQAQQQAQAAARVNNVPVVDKSTSANAQQLAQQSGLSRAEAAIQGQDFTPQLPNTAGGWLGMAYNPFSPFTQSFRDQTRYGMSPASQSVFDGMNSAVPSLNTPFGWANMSPEEQVNVARNQVMQDQAAPNSYTGPQKPSNFSDQQWNSMTQGQRQFMSPEGAFGGQAGMPNASGGYGGGNGGGMNTQGIAGGATVPLGDTNSTFRPVTFRSAQDMLGQGEGLLGQAGALAQQAPDEFNYNFDPTQAGQDLFDQRSALLEPQFAQQNTRAQESMFGTGRLGLRLAGEGLGAGEGSGMMSPDAFGVNTAQSQALAQLAAQSTDDAFGQELQRSGLDLSEYNANQMAQQQQYANLMGAGQGMFGAGGQLVAQGQQQQGLDQNYQLGLYGNETARITGQAQANRANYQPDPWLSGLTSLGSAFLGNDAGGGWLSGILGRKT